MNDDAGRGGGLAAVFLDGEYEDAGYYGRWADAADLVVAADGGARFLAAAGVVPALLVGDFDSLDEEALRAAAAGGAEIVRHPVRKDQTDGELAVAEAVRRGAGELVLAGALGALDHVLGHLSVLAHAESGGTPARLVSPALCARVLVAPAAVALDAPPGTRVSLAPLAGEAVVSLYGLDYRLERGRLPADACLGLGNTVKDAAAITVHEGRVAALVFAGDEGFGGLRRLRRAGG